MAVYDYTFYDLINRNAVCFNDRQAWVDVDDQRSLTFVEFKEQVDRLAKGLEKAGVKKGDRIGVLGKNSLEYILLYGACAALGAIMVVINWRLSAEEALFNLNDCEPKHLFVDAEFQEMIASAPKKLASVKHYYNLNPTGGNFTEFESLMDNPGDFESVDVATDDGLVILSISMPCERD